MKQILLSFMLLTGISFSFAGNGNGDGNPPCNCNSRDKVDIYANGQATIVNGTKVQCDGDEGTCWDIVLKPGGGWTLTIYTEPPISFGNANGPENPPQGPVLAGQGANYSVYEWNPDVWNKK